MKTLLIVVLAGAFGGMLLAAERPNLVVILADDLGWGDVGCNHPGSKIATPNIDRIAREGMRFTDAHSSSGVCTPSRYSLLTGRYHWRTRLQKGVLGGFSRPLIDARRTTLASFLRDQGYHSACIGKWHLGMDWPLRDGGVADDGGDFSKPFSDLAKVDYASPIRNGPVDRGFDRFFGISASLDMYPYVWIEDRHPTEVASVEKAFHRPGPAGAEFEAIQVQTEITERLIAYLKERAPAARAGEPFFAYVPLASPHTPILPLPEFQGKSGINAYADFILQIDADLGRILEALDAEGLAASTLLVFTSDNGCSPQAQLGELQAVGHSPSGPFRGHKADLYEGGHRVPFLVRWPSQIAAGRVSDEIVGQIDLLATMADLIGVKLPEDAAEDSISFLPALRGAAGGRGRSGIVSQSIDGSLAIREGSWKLLLCPGSGGWSYPRPGRDVVSGMPERQLYDLAADPGETRNLIGIYPERAERMEAALREAIAQGRTTPGPSLSNDVEVAP